MSPTLHQLTSSQIPFNAYPAPNDAYLYGSSLLENGFNTETPQPIFSGFKVVKGLIPYKQIIMLRDFYYSLFSDCEYSYTPSGWVSIKESVHSHGTSSHPARIFVRHPIFLDFIRQPVINKVASYFLSSSRATLCRRSIVRSFSNISTRCTSAHRDCDYFRTTSNKEVITVWIPLGPVGIEHGQLIYLENSETMTDSIQPLVRQNHIISKDLGALATQLRTRWLLPDIAIGDVVFHCLDIVHASFDSRISEPRLSCDLRFASSPEYIDKRWTQDWSGDDGL